MRLEASLATCIIDCKLSQSKRKLSQSKRKLFQSKRKLYQSKRKLYQSERKLSRSVPVGMLGNLAALTHAVTRL